jgi:uncharacterized protein
VARPSPLPQLVPSSTCFRCDVCCRFPESDSFLRPYFTKQEIAEAIAYGVPASSFPDPSGSQVELVKHPIGEGYLCPAFDPITSRCGIYEARPLDCQLYPLALMWDAGRERVLLGWDTKCPFMSETVPTAITTHAERVAGLLATEVIVDMIAANPRVVGRFQDDVVVLQDCPQLTARLRSSDIDPRLHPLTWSDGPLVASALEQAHVLSSDALAAYAFPYHYMWTPLLSYWWMESNETLYLFAKSPDGWFMPLIPLGPRPLEETVVEAFRLMQEWNGPSPVSRIENVMGPHKKILEQAGFHSRRKEGDYLYQADALAALAGDPYKSQRALCNRAEREQALVLEPYQERHLPGCRSLYETWATQKRQGDLDQMGRFLLEDAQAAHDLVLTEHARIGLSGTVVTVEGRVVAYTFGYWLRPETWCILLEVADRSRAGLAQWLFRETCRTASSQGAISINAMDDAGLAGLREAKQAYRPLAVIENWIMTGFSA